MTSIPNTVLELTDRVEAAIDAGDWQLAHELEGARAAELERLVQVHADTAERQAVMDALQSRTHRLIGIVEHHRRRVLREAATVKTGFTGAARYVETLSNDVAG